MDITALRHRHHQFGDRFCENAGILAHGLNGFPTTARVLEQNPEITTPDALPDTTPVSRKNGDPVLGRGLAFDASTNSQDSENKRLPIRPHNDRLYCN